MKLLFIVLIPLQCFSQFDQIRLSDGADLKLDFLIINDTIGCLQFREFEYEQSLLVKYEHMVDSVLMYGFHEEMDMNADIFIGARNIDSDSVYIESLFVHLLVEGETIFNGLRYKINSQYIIPKVKDKMHTAQFAKSPDNIYDIEIFNGNILFSAFEVELNNESNLIQYKATKLFSTFDYSLDLELIFPIVLTIRDKEIKFVYLDN